MRALSLRATFFAGTLAIVVPVVATFAAVVYARERAAAERAFDDALRIRAKAVSGLVEIDLEEGVVEVEPYPAEMPEFARSGSGSYYAVADEKGVVFARSPSLGSEAPPDAAPAAAPHPRRFRLEAGPFGRPCAAGTYLFRALSEKEARERAAAGDDSAPDGGGSGFLVTVALDSRESDRALASLAAFLATAGLLAVILSLFGAALLGRRLVVPIRRMTAAAARLSPGGESSRLEPKTVVRELESLAATLNAAFDGMSEALRRQKKFTADAGHELRTPVTVILGNAELLLRRERGAAEYREGLALQLRGARRMARIVDGLLFLARSDAFPDDFDRRPLDLTEVARAASEDWEPVARDAEIEFDSRLDGSVRVIGDANRLRQVADNLFSNAVKYTPRGGRVIFETAVVDGSGALRVTNSGPGISPEHLRHVFERFYRGDVRRGGDGERAPGAGLGLAIVEGIVRSHGGAVRAESREGEGATFEVRIPLAP